jgi:hypothetical protein
MVKALGQCLAALSILLIASLLMMTHTVKAEDVTLGVCDEVEVDSEDYRKYTSKATKFHSIKPFANVVGGPAWKEISVKETNHLILTINSIDDSEYCVYMDTHDYSSENLNNQVVIKMSLSQQKVTRYFQMKDFNVCRIKHLQHEETPSWEYYIEPFTYTR